MTVNISKLNGPGSSLGVCIKYTTLACILCQGYLLVTVTGTYFPPKLCPSLEMGQNPANKHYNN